jgi:hypothetical protein
MRIKLLSLVVTSFITVLTVAQGLTINPGTTFKANAGISIVIHNTNLVNNGNGDLSKSNLYLTGNTQDNISGTSATTVSNLYINENASTATLRRNLGVTNNVVFQNGLLDLNGHNLLLSPAGLLVGENEFNHVTGPSGGYVSITVPLNAPSGANPGNLGAIISSAKDMGSVVVQRGHNSQTKLGSGKSILRYYNIQPSINTGLKAVFRFTYLDAELNGLTESGLNMWKSANGGTNWTILAASGQNIALNFVEASNVNTFYRYTLSSSAFTFNKPVAENMKAATDNRVSSVVLSPNPVSIKEKVTISSPAAFNSNLTVFTNDGKKLIQQPVHLDAGINQVTVDMHLLVPGTYYLVIEMSDGTRKTIPFIKQ